MRIKTKVERVFKRYYAMSEAIGKLKKAAAEAMKRLGTPGITSETRKDIISGLKALNSKALYLTELLANDFPIYEMEKEYR